MSDSMSMILCRKNGARQNRSCGPVFEKMFERRSGNHRYKWEVLKKTLIFTSSEPGNGAIWMQYVQRQAIWKARVWLKVLCIESERMDHTGALLPLTEGQYLYPANGRAVQARKADFEIQQKFKACTSKCWLLNNVVWSWREFVQALIYMFVTAKTPLACSQKPLKRREWKFVGPPDSKTRAV